LPRAPAPGPAAGQRTGRGYATATVKRFGPRAPGFQARPMAGDVEPTRARGREPCRRRELPPGGARTASYRCPRCHRPVVQARTARRLLPLNGLGTEGGSKLSLANGARPGLDGRLNRRGHVRQGGIGWVRGGSSVEGWRSELPSITRATSQFVLGGSATAALTPRVHGLHGDLGAARRASGALGSSPISCQTRRNCPGVDHGKVARGIELRLVMRKTPRRFWTAGVGHGVADPPGWPSLLSRSASDIV